MIIKGMIFDLADRVGNTDLGEAIKIGEAVATIEGILADVGDRRWKNDSAETRAAIKRTLTDADKARGQDQGAGEASTALKRTIADPGDRRWQL